MRVLIVDEGASERVDDLVRLAQDRGVEVRRVGARAVRRMAGPGEDALALALVGADPKASLSEMCERAGAVWLLVGTEYPGNAGLAARTAEVAGAAGVCIDAPFDAGARKACLRASMHSERFMPIHFVEADQALHAARAVGRRVVVVEDVGDRPPWEADLVAPALFVVGGEACGVPTAIIDAADVCIRIPTPGFVSSYNLQAAMAAVVGEQLRQRASEK